VNEQGVAVQHDSYRNIQLVNESGVLWATIDHPPVNLIDEPLILELERLGNEVADLNDVSVLVLKSADPDFFLAHVDVGRIEDEPTTAPPRGSDIGRWHTMCERFRTLPQATIGMVEGRARGGASEILLSLDMIFGAKETATFSQPEVGFGIIPGGCGCVRLPYAVGRGRALEIILGCEDFSADLAERYGWINRALPRDEPIREALLTELWALNSSLATSDARKLMTYFMSEYAQRREHELVLNDVVAEMNRMSR
jgi:enoyl-CoA hydratase/carnithine racemase